MGNRFFVVIFIFLNYFSYSQIENPDIFREPMDLPIELSGSFSELRTVNFHSGIDIRVINRPHRRVYAIGDGYVSRIKVEPAGYGNALYITHPQGYVSVYAHLDTFSPEVEQFVKQTQYNVKSFFIDTTLHETLFPVKQGDIIGIAGNTGYSFGAHLHFEIRDAATEETLDPLLFGFKVKDTSAPQFLNLKLYPHGNSLINNKNQNLILKTVKQSNGRYGITSVLETSGAVSFGFDITDKQNNSNPNRLGLKFMKVYVDDSLLVDLSFDHLNFDIVRHQLAYIDYPERERTKKRFQRTWKKPGNNLPIYKFIRDEGIVHINETKQYTIRCIIGDIGENQSELVFKMKGSSETQYNPQTQCDDHSVLLRWDTLNTWSGQNTEVHFPIGTLFSDECIIIREGEHSENEISATLEILSEEALSGFYKIRIKSSAITEETQGITIARAGTKNQHIGLKTQYIDGWHEALSRSFGSYKLIKDSLPPQIKPVLLPSNGVITGQKKISFKVTDDVCGIDTYNAYINEEWILLQYDLKDDEMYYIIDERLPKGESVLKLVITDNCGNISNWEKTLVR